MDRLAALIQPTNVHALRQMAHATVVEVLLYMSPSTRQRILDSLTDALNVIYHRFKHRNPAFQVRASRHSFHVPSAVHTISLVVR